MIITQSLNIPLLGKYLPSKVDIQHLLIDCNGIDLDTAALAFEWDSWEGVAVAFGPGIFSIAIPINKTFFDAFTIMVLRATIEDNTGGPGTWISIGMDASLTLGPFTGIVQDVGLRALVSNPGDSTANFGPLLIENIGLKPPTGIGLSIDASGFKGGGFIFFDKDKGEYAGVLELSFAESFSITAIALLTTKLPSGNNGISL
jgi:hypothetical protein